VPLYWSPVSGVAAELKAFDVYQTDGLNHRPQIVRDRIGQSSGWERERVVARNHQTREDHACVARLESALVLGRGSLARQGSYEKRLATVDLADDSACRCQYWLLTPYVEAREVIPQLRRVRQVQLCRPRN